MLMHPSKGVGTNNGSLGIYCGLWSCRRISTMFRHL